jgi:superoxide dismutase, Cu-Zn family
MKRPSVAQRIVLAGFAAVGVSAAPWLVGRAGADTVAKLHAVTAKGVEKDEIGTVTLVADPKGGVGVSIIVDGILPGRHFVDLHESGSCEPGTVNGKPSAAGAAGPIFKPKGMALVEDSRSAEAMEGKRASLKVDSDREGGAQFTLRGISLKDVAGRSLVIQGGGDNTLEAVPPMVVEKGAVACAVIPKQ